MTVKEILGTCLNKMGAENFINEETFSQAQQRTADRLLASLNICYKEILASYLPYVCEENVFSREGEIRTDSLNNSILYPISLIYEGEKRKFRTYPDRIACNFSGDADLIYAYLPQAELTLEDSVSDSRLTAGIMADGVLAQYYFQNKVFELAKSFDTDFRAALNSIRYKGRRMRIPERRWQA